MHHSAKTRLKQPCKLTRLAARRGGEVPVCHRATKPTTPIRPKMRRNLFQKKEVRLILRAQRLLNKLSRLKTSHLILVLLIQCLLDKAMLRRPLKRMMKLSERKISRKLWVISFSKTNMINLKRRKKRLLRVLQIRI